MDTPNSKLVRKTEHAIQSILKTEPDYERSMPLINQLEDISYQLWMESNTAFLDETFISMCSNDDEWQWDEECFFDSETDCSIQEPTQANTDEHVAEDLDISLDSYSSLGSSVRVCEDSDCSIGYLASCESNMSEIPDEIAEAITSVSDDWVIVDSEREIKVDSDWLVLSTPPPSVNGEITDSFEELCASDNTALEHLANSSDGDNRESMDDWAVLSMKITELKNDRVVGSNTLELSRDSGFKSPENVRTTTPAQSFDLPTDFNKCFDFKDKYSKESFRMNSTPNIMLSNTDFGSIGSGHPTRGELIFVCVYTGVPSVNQCCSHCSGK